MSTNISNPEVVTKYRTSSQIANKVLAEILSSAKPQSSIFSLCTQGDSLITSACKSIYNKGGITKGIAMPTCISVNNQICHVSPLVEEEGAVLKKGDVVKVELGVHVDGYCAMVSGTVVVGEEKVEGAKANVVKAAWDGLQAALRTVKVGNTNTQVSTVVQQVCEGYKCQPVQGMMSHALEQQEVAGEKSILLNPTEALRKTHEECTFEELEVYHVDIVVSTGDGAGKTNPQVKTTVYKRTKLTYMLKLKASRAFLAETKPFGNLPFSLRQVEDEKKARLGLNECLKSGVCLPYDILYEKEGTFVAQFGATILLMPSGPLVITESPFNPAAYKTDSELCQELKDLLATPIRPIKKK